MTTLPKENNDSQEEEERKAKIQELREIIANAQETISSATQLLSAIQGTTPTEMPINQVNNPEEEDGQAVFGYFDGQIMIGDDGRQYPVPANYASKSKLVEGDKLKLNITSDNRFVYKQIGPVQRNYLIGLVKKDEKGNFTIQTPEKEYQVLLAAATYFKIEEGDEVTLIVPQGKATIWGAIENVLQKSPTLTAITTAPVAAPTADLTDFSKNTPDSETSEEDEDILEIDLSEEPISTENKNNEEIVTNDNRSNKLKEGENLTGNTTSDANSKEEKKLTAIEKLEMGMEKERITQIKANPISPDEENKERTSQGDSDDEWASDIEKLKQEAGIAVNQGN